MNDYPKELQKKIILLHHFKNYLECENNNNGQQIPVNVNKNNQGENNEEK